MTTKCLRCGRTLTATKSVADRMGRGCKAKVRQAAKEAALAKFADKPHLIAKAEELIEQGGIVAIRGGRVFRTIGSTGSSYLTAPEACNCAAGLRGRNVCHHRIAATVMRASLGLAA